MHELKSLSGQYGVIAVNPSAPDPTKVMSYGIILSSSPADTLKTLQKQESCKGYVAATYDIGGQSVSVVVFTCGKGYGVDPVSAALEDMLPPLEKHRAAAARRAALRKSQDIESAADMVMDGVSLSDATALFPGISEEEVKSAVQAAKLARQTRR